MAARSRSRGAASPRLVEDFDDDGRAFDKSDDEEIDEDEAFNSEDELTYGGFFSSSKKSPSKSKGGGKSGDDDENDDSDEGESDDEGGRDSESDSENDWAGSDDDGEEDDDGGQYMLDLLDNLDRQSGKNPPGKSGEGGIGGRKIAPDSAAASEAAARIKEGEFGAGALSAMSGVQGELTLDSLMGGISNTSGFASVQRSMRALVGGVKASDGGVKKVETTSVPAPRVVSERASRKVHYQATSEDVGRWRDAVHEQRDAETLDFRTNKGGRAANRITRDVLVDKFEASNDFERELQDALEKAGMEDEEAMRRREKRLLTGEADDGDEEAGGVGAKDDDDLGSSHITLAEYKKRHAELAKMRSLMFQEEQRNHRINKIKSKKYRKIRKRRRERMKEAEEEAAKLDDPDGALEREKIEREEMDRMRERMSLAHRNTSKWARRVLRRGAKMDNDERRALSLQIARGEELRRKVMGEEDGDGSRDGSETEEDLLRKARDILMEDEDNEDGGEGKEKKGKGLFQLDFMKRGMEAQRVRAKEEARRLLDELEANAASVSTDEDEEDNGDFDEEEKNSPNQEGKEKVATEAEIAKVLPEGGLVASCLRFGRGDRFAVAVDGNIELDENKVNEAIQGDAVLESSPIGKEDERSGKGKKKRRKRKKKENNNGGGDGNASAAKGDQSFEASKAAAASLQGEDNDGEEEENPWLAPRRARKKPAAGSRPKAVDIAQAASMLVDDSGSAGGGVQIGNRTDPRPGESEGKRGSDAAGGSATVAAREGPAVGVADLSQAELVRRAFASPADLEAEEEFRKEKERMKERDDPTRKKEEEKFVSGWGSWAGAGAPPPKKPLKLPAKLQAPTKKVIANAPKRKDDGKSTVIINEKRIKKMANQFQLSKIPYPYRTREEYERSIAGSIGREWNTMQGSKEMSRPAVLVRAGKVIRPVEKGSKAKATRGKRRDRGRAPAKF